MITLRKTGLFLSITAFLMFPCLSVQAQEATGNGNAEVMDLPAVSTAANDPITATHPIIRLMPDRSELVKLEGEAASVIVGSPAHVSVLLDTPDTLVVVPRAPGASHFTVIGKDGSVLMQRHVIVGGAKEKYIRIRRSCGPNDRGCQPTSVYFCPDMCHEVKGEDGSNSRSGGFSFF